MKKFILLILILFLFIPVANASVKHEYLNSVSHFGIGAATVSKDVKIYSEPNTDSKMVQEIFWDKNGILYCKNKNLCSPFDMFLAFSPENNNAIFSVEDENEDWIYVCYSQKKRLFGWIKKEDDTKYYNWSELLIKFGKKYGMYLFRDVPSDTRRLYAGPSIEAGSVDSFTLATKITPWLVRGNWVLVKVENYDGKTKTGWMRYRTDSGRLLGFVNVE